MNMVNVIATVYPNPASNMINFTLSNKNGKVTAMLIDMNGAVIINEVVTENSQGVFRLNIKNKPVPGNYLLQVISDNLKESIKVSIH